MVYWFYWYYLKFVQFLIHNLVHIEQFNGSIEPWPTAGGSIINQSMTNHPQNASNVELSLLRAGGEDADQMATTSPLQLPLDLQLIIYDQLSLRDMVALMQTSRSHAQQLNDYVTSRALQPNTPNSTDTPSLMRLVRYPERLRTLMPSINKLPDSARFRLLREFNQEGETALLLASRTESPALSLIINLILQLPPNFAKFILSQASLTGINAPSWAVRAMHPDLALLLNCYLVFDPLSISCILTQTANDGKNLFEVALEHQPADLVLLTQLATKLNQYQKRYLLTNQKSVMQFIGFFAPRRHTSGYVVFVNFISTLSTSALLNFLSYRDEAGFNIPMLAALEGEATWDLVYELIQRLEQGQQLKLLHQLQPMGHSLVTVSLHAELSVMHKVISIMQRLDSYNRYEIIRQVSKDGNSLLMNCLYEKPERFPILCNLYKEFNDISLEQLLKHRNNLGFSILLLAMQRDFDSFFAIINLVSHRSPWLIMELLLLPDLQGRSLVSQALDYDEIYSRHLWHLLRELPSHYITRILDNKSTATNYLLELLDKQLSITTGVLQVIHSMPKIVQFMLLRKRDGLQRHALLIAIQRYPAAVPLIMDQIRALPEAQRDYILYTPKAPQVNLFALAFLHHPQSLLPLFRLIQEAAPRVQATLLLQFVTSIENYAWISLVAAYPSCKAEIQQMVPFFSKTKQRLWQQSQSCQIGYQTPFLSLVDRKFGC